MISPRFVPDMGTVFIAHKILSMSHKYEKFRKTIHEKEHVALRELLKNQREELGLTQRDLGERLKVHHTLVGKVETGDRRLDVIEFIDYCKALEVAPCLMINTLKMKAVSS